MRAFSLDEGEFSNPRVVLCDQRSFHRLSLRRAPMHRIEISTAHFDETRLNLSPLRLHGDANFALGHCAVGRSISLTSASFASHSSPHSFSSRRNSATSRCVAVSGAGAFGRGRHVGLVRSGCACVSVLISTVGGRVASGLNHPQAVKFDAKNRGNRPVR